MTAGVLIFILVLTAASGVGLSVGLKNWPLNDANDITLATHPTSITSSTVSTPSTLPSATATASALTHGAMLDTFIASVVTSGDSRQLFFQDFNGTLRHAVYSAETNG